MTDLIPDTARQEAIEAMLRANADAAIGAFGKIMRYDAESMLHAALPVIVAAVRAAVADKIAAEAIGDVTAEPEDEWVAGWNRGVARAARLARSVAALNPPRSANGAKNE